MVRPPADAESSGEFLSERRALLSLEGLAIGDAFGQLVLDYGDWLFAGRGIPRGPWPWTDDTQMALSVVQALRELGGIDGDRLLGLFVDRYLADPLRGYDWISIRVLRRRATGGREDSIPWPVHGMIGNGAAMRVAPLGAWFADDPGRAVYEALQSARASHDDADCQAGAMAVAAMAALVAGGPGLKGVTLLERTVSFVPPGPTRRGLEQAAGIPAAQHFEAVRQLGTGVFRASRDTVPYALWCAAHHLDDFEEALWETVSGLGDTDTTCAIVGGLVALRTGSVPPWLLTAREPLPEGYRLFPAPDEGDWRPPQVPREIRDRVGMLESFGGIGDS